MHETLATMITSSRLTRALVAARRRRSMFSLIEGVFFDVDVALRDVRFGLVVVVIADEIVDGVVREEAAGTPCRAGRPASCCATRTSVGLPSWAMTLAAVKVLPVPVAPSSVWQGRPSLEASTSLAMACG